MTTNNEFTRAELIELAITDLGLTRAQAVEYVMERTYNQMSHRQALAELRRKGIIH